MWGGGLGERGSFWVIQHALCKGRVPGAADGDGRAVLGVTVGPVPEKHRGGPWGSMGPAARGGSGQQPATPRRRRRVTSVRGRRGYNVSNGRLQTRQNVPSWDAVQTNAGNRAPLPRTAPDGLTDKRFPVHTGWRLNQQLRAWKIVHLKSQRMNRKGQD